MNYFEYKTPIQKCVPRDFIVSYLHYSKKENTTLSHKVASSVYYLRFNKVCIYWQPLHLAQSQPHCKDLPAFLLFIMLHTTRATIPTTIANTIAVPIIPFISMLLSEFLLYNSYCFAYLFFLNSKYASATVQMIATINPTMFTLPANNRPN